MITILPETYDKESFINQYVPSYNKFIENVVEEICKELRLSEEIIEMGRSHPYAFFEILEVFGENDVFERHNERLLNLFINEWMPYLLKMTEQYYPSSIAVDKNIIKLGIDGENSSYNTNIEEDRVDIFGELDDILRIYFVRGKSTSD